MASNDKRVLVNRLSGTAGRGTGANTGLGTADVIVPEFPKLPSRLTEESARQFRQEIERWRASLQGQFPIPIQAGGTVDTSGIQSQIDAAYAAIDSLRDQIGADAGCHCTKADIGLGNVDNTSDLDKPISIPTRIGLDDKAALNHVHPLSQLTQSGAASGQVATWDGSAWVPAAPAVYEAEVLVKEATPGLANERVVTDSITVTAQWSVSGQVTFQRTALSGDVVASANSNQTTISPGAVNTAKLGGDITAAGKAILDDATATDQRTTLGATTYIHTQGSAANPWVITHNLNAFPTVWVIDPLNRAGYAEVEYEDANTVKVYFGGQQTGTAYLNF